MYQSRSGGTFYFPIIQGGTSIQPVATIFAGLMSFYLNKWLLIPVLLLLPRLALQAQDFSDLKEVDFKSPASCKQYEQKALECAEYILSTAQLPADQRRAQALQFMIRWMGATPDYQFNLNDRVGRWLNNEETLLVNIWQP